MDTPYIVLYIEGGHRDDAAWNADFRSANVRFRVSITSFIEKALPDCEIYMDNLNIVVCGGRDEAIKRFNDAVENLSIEEKRRGKRFNVVRILLVDSEGAVGKSRGCKAHLNRQKGAKLGRKVKENTVFLMVQCMESWFLTDPDGLEQYYRRQGYNFDKVVLANEIIQAKGGDPARNTEQIPKTDKGTFHNGEQVGNIPAFIISQAIRERDYRKSDGFELFGFINPNKTIAESPHCDDFISIMRTRLC